MRSTINHHHTLLFLLPLSQLNVVLVVSTCTFICFWIQRVVPACFHTAMIRQQSSKGENNRYKESKNKSLMQKSDMDSVEFELSAAKTTVRELALRIEEANSRLKGVQRKPKWCEQEVSKTSIQIEDDRYAQVMNELENMKQELSKLKLDMTRVLKEKRHAERSLKASSSKKKTLSASIELMKKEIQELNEEQALVEFARIQAVNECESIESKRIEDYNRLLEAKKLVEEKNLQITVCDLNLSPLNSINEELDATKRELALIKGEGFNFMTSLDVIRDELKHVRAETVKLQKTVQKRDLTVQNLNSKILRARAKLESLTSAESKTKIVESNLVYALDQLRAEVENSKKEKYVIDEEIENMNEKVHNTETEIEIEEGKLETALEELKAVKLSESEALGNLRDLIGTTVVARGTTSMNSSMITITEFEYEYLTGNARVAADVANKKIEAAEAWVEALKANEKEILMKVEMRQREVSELSVEVNEEEVDGPGLRAKVVGTPRRRSVYKVGSMGSVKRAKLQRIRTSMVRSSGKTGSFSKEKVIPKLTRLFSNNVESGE
ncbi:protein PLASTID MOVEMENT IMPAIRED 2-like isoform X2 [Rutidosis leptorrhynchoides]|uniref:protein PLASTID MOVEMENT IMPAIRED 2-like isoform X2 n=1 Tax=Rutidosis leptorrhynchoides TaxID=125765 RepID=UPI003A9973BE